MHTKLLILKQRTQSILATIATITHGSIRNKKRKIFGSEFEFRVAEVDVIWFITQTEYQKCCFYKSNVGWRRNKSLSKKRLFISASITTLALKRLEAGGGLWTTVNMSVKNGMSYLSNVSNNTLIV